MYKRITSLVIIHQLNVIARSLALFPAECEDDEIMSNPTVIADDQITDCQEKDKDTPAPQAKPGGSGYVKPVPAGLLGAGADNKTNTNDNDKPCLKVVLTSKTSPEPKTVSKLVVEGNVKTVTVLKKVEQGEEGEEKTAQEGQTTTPASSQEENKKQPLFKPVLENVDVDENGVLLLPTPIKMEALKVIFEKPKDDKDTNFKATLKVHACGKFESECCYCWCLSIIIACMYMDMFIAPKRNTQYTSSTRYTMFASLSLSL